MLNSNTSTGVARITQPKSQNIVICGKREDPFARIPKTVLDDISLSWRAKGILCYLLGKPSGWKTRVTDIRKHAKEGERAVRAALMELRKAGYAQLVQLRDGQRIKEWVWKISDSPIFKGLDGRNVDVENEDVQNAHHSKNEGIKNECIKNESKESEVTSQSDALSFSSFNAEWKPNRGTKTEKLKRIKPPSDYPSEREFESFIAKQSLDQIECYRPDLYASLCDNKWHQWKESLTKWVRIRDWRKYVVSLNEKIGGQFS